MIKAANYPHRADDEDEQDDRTLPLHQEHQPRIDHVEYEIDPIAGESEIDAKARASLKRNFVVK